jgi:catechol 2,3-dioxygenase-like lactoylglutathione lyase family enzyme
MTAVALPVVGLHHVKIPVGDLPSTREWFESLLGLEVEIEFRDDDGTVRGVAYLPIGGLRIALREDPFRASVLAGWDPLALAVPSRADLDIVAAHLDGHGVEHGPVVRATLGWLLSADAPGGLQLRFYTDERHD